MLWRTVLVACLANICLSQRFSRQGRNTCSSGSSCVAIFDCPPAVEMIEKSKQTRSNEFHAYLKSLFCGWSGTSKKNQPLVCCPETKPNSTDNVLPSAPDCGKSGDIDFQRIQGGSPATLGQWPWMAALGYTKKRSNGNEISWLCGGSLITRSHVLTAAHCIFPPRFTLQTVRLGDLNLNDRVNDGATPVEKSISMKIVHEGYGGTANDIAIIKLNKPVTYTPLIQPICLPKLPELRSKTFETNSPYTAGWGKLYYNGPSPTHLQTVQFPVIKNEECAKIFSSMKMRDTQITGPQFVSRITSTQICAGELNGGKDSCTGDSGGPLMVPQGINFYHIGLVSFGHKCGVKGLPGVYTRTSEYMDWISAKVKL